MDTSRIAHVFGMAVTIMFACYFYLPPVSAGEFSGTEWKVTRGDTLYAISRTIFPKNTSKQAQLRHDIITLNPAVFAGGANNIKIGVVLKLPDYVIAKSIETKKVETTRFAPKGVTPETLPSGAIEQAPVPVPAEITSKPGLSAVRTGEVSSTVWKVKQGDTLYTICRSIYPGNARMQAQLGRDIKKLNPTVFASGAGKMKVGVVLKLPDYVKLEGIKLESVEIEKIEPESIPSKTGAPGPEPESVTPGSTQQPVTSAVVVEHQPEVPMVAKQPKTPTPAFSSAEEGIVVSLGFSNGGDQLVSVDNGFDINTGTGIHFRLGYEQMFQNNSGYRMLLGLQYYKLISESTSYSDTYLLLAYQYHTHPILFGVGAILDAGAKLENNTTAEFDPAIGGTMYVEYVGKGKLAGWGIGATSLNIKEKNTGAKFNATRGELYYRWRF